MHNKQIDFKQRTTNLDNGKLINPDSVTRAKRKDSQDDRPD